MPRAQRASVNHCIADRNRSFTARPPRSLRTSHGPTETLKGSSPQYRIWQTSASSKKQRQSATALPLLYFILIVSIPHFKKVKPFLKKDIDRKARTRRLAADLKEAGNSETLYFCLL